MCNEHYFKDIALFIAVGKLISVMFAVLSMFHSFPVHRSSIWFYSVALLAENTPHSSMCIEIA